MGYNSVMAMLKSIMLKNCRANNLQGVCAEIRFGELTVLAGGSGCGKSSFAYDSLYKMEKCAVSGRPESVVYISQKTPATSEKWRGFVKAVKGLAADSLIIVDELGAGMTSKEAKAAARELSLLARKGHAVVAVEHRRELITQADRVLVFGPRAGAGGGRIIADISGKEYKDAFPPPARAGRAPNKSAKKLSALWEEFGGVKKYGVDFPLHKIAAVCGSMSSGKSTFLAGAFAACDKSAGAGERRGKVLEISGKQHIRRPHIVDAAPISKNPRSSVATYYGISRFLDPQEKELTIDEIAAKRAGDKLLERRLGHLCNVGLGYLRASQPSYTLSGGECQRLKLAKMLCKKLGDRSLYIFDNPVRGLDEAGAANIMLMFDALVKANNSVLIAENDPGAMAYADATIDLDP